MSPAFINYGQRTLGRIDLISKQSLFINVKAYNVNDTIENVRNNYLNNDCNNNQILQE